MALSIMPADEMAFFKRTVQWLLEKDHSKFKCPYALKAFVRFTPGFNPYKHIANFLFLRKDNPKGTVPYAIYVICFSNWMFQIFLPFCDKDSDLENTQLNIEFVAFPSPFDSDFPLGDTKIIVQDFSSSELIKGDTVNITYSFDEMVEVKDKYNGAMLKE